jgi:hypothetical protein
MAYEPLTEEYLNAIRKRCNAATSGPWISYVEGRDHTSGDNVIVRGKGGNENDLYIIGGSVADQDFIASAREDIPRLLEEIDRLKRSAL